MMTWNSPVQNQKNVSFYIFPDLKEGIDKVAKSVYNYGFKVTPFAHVLEKKVGDAKREILEKIGKMSLKSSPVYVQFFIITLHSLT